MRFRTTCILNEFYIYYNKLFIIYIMASLEAIAQNNKALISIYEDRKKN